jgi:DNA-binding response OmpR family regulator
MSEKPYVPFLASFDVHSFISSKIKQINPSIQILVVAEHHSDKAKVLEYGADEFTIKPISAETVVNKLIAMLEQEKSHR